MKPLLIILGTLSAFLIVLQVVLGLAMRSGQPSLATSHFHLGTTMAVVTLVYIALSLTAILSKPRRQAP
jgi:heme A synthase